MTPLRKGVVVAVVHLLLVATLAAKLLYDRATRPRVWVATAAYDPDMPIRGRYVDLRLVVDAPDIIAKDNTPLQGALVTVDRGRLVAQPAEWEHANGRVRFIRVDGRKVSILDDPVAFFIPEHVPDPSLRPAGEVLWVEVTVPKRGPPRPIRLGVKKGEGQIEPLNLR